MDLKGYPLYCLLIGAIIYFVYQINSKDYSNGIEYFSEDIPLKRSLPSDVIINMKNFQFNPDYILIPVNTKVVWINLDSDSQSYDRTHAIKEKYNAFQSSDLPVNQKFTYEFDCPGTYSYYDPHNPKMSGTIVVTGETLV